MPEDYSTAQIPSDAGFRPMCENWISLWLHLDRKFQNVPASCSTTFGITEVAPPPPDTHTRAHRDDQQLPTVVSLWFVILFTTGVSRPFQAVWREHAHPMDLRQKQSNRILGQISLFLAIFLSCIQHPVAPRWHGILHTPVFMYCAYTWT